MRTKSRARRAVDRHLVADDESIASFSAFLAVPDALAHLLSFFTRRQAAKLCVVSRSFKEAYDGMQSLGLQHRPVLLVACSPTAQLLEVDPGTGGVKALCKLSIQMKRHKSRPPPRWATGITACNGTVYACQYQVNGVVRAAPQQLRKQGKVHLAVSGQQLAAPEGIVVFRNWLYVGCIDYSCINQALLARCSPAAGGAEPAAAVGSSSSKVVSSYDLSVHYPDGEGGQYIVPWGMALGPDSCLYIALDQGYDVPSYANPPDAATGCIVRVQLDESTGALTGGSRFGPHPLLRPSGVAFSPSGHLLATTMARRLLVLAGPALPQPGTTLADFDTGSWWDGIPWDVACLGSSVYVTMHNGDLVDTAEDCTIVKLRLCGQAGIGSAVLLGRICSPLMRQANMMCVYR